MALGFLKKVFSFGKKEVEEVPADAAAPGDEAGPEEAAAPGAPQPQTARQANEEDGRAEEAREAGFEAPEVPEFLRRSEAGKPPAPAPEEPSAAETWDAPEPEDQATPEQAREPEPPEPEPVPEVPIETPDAPREEPPEPLVDEIREEAERAADPAPESEEPEPATREPASGQETAVPDGDREKALETPPEPPAEAPDAAHLDKARTEPPAADVAEPAPEPEPEEAAPAPEVAPPAEDPIEEAVPPAPSPAPAGGRVSVGKAVARKAEAPAAPEPPAGKKPWFRRLTEGLSRSSRELKDNISGVLTKRRLDEDTLQDLEDVLLRADLGLETAMRVTDALSSGRYGKDVSEAEVRSVMAEEVEKVLVPVALPLELDLSHKPHVILVVGVNGTGKTTTIGKLTAKLRQGGLSVMIAAGDTFRAAAIEQLTIWGERTGAPVVSSKLGADAAGLAWDAYEKAKQAGSDVLIIDTAGRLQNKAELMAELEKIVRVLGKHDAEAPHTVLQTVDATTGQNALGQVEIFKNVAGVNGLVMTKLDGTARGGILVAIAAKHKLPVYFIGVGEQVDDLEPFSAGDFARAIAGVE